MSFFAPPMYLSPPPATVRRYGGRDYARHERGYAACYARRATAQPVCAQVIAWPSCALARVGDAWVVRDCARAA